MHLGYSRRPMSWVVWLQEVARMRVNDFLRKCVVFIGAKTEHGFEPVGTAFLLTLEDYGRRFDHVVTARHNIEMIPGDMISIRVNRKGGGAEVITTSRGEWHFIEQVKGKPYIDIAVLPTHGIDVSGADLDVLNVPAIPGLYTDKTNSDLMAGAPVVMIGLFTSHYGEAHNIPIVRQGHVATMRDPSNPVPTSHGPMDAYLVEVRSLGGLSGSPVFQAIEPYWHVAEERKTAHALKPFYLIGIMQGHYVTKTASDIVWPSRERAQKATKPKKIEDFLSPDEYNAGIGVVVPADYIMETINLPILREKREAIATDLNKKSGHRDDSVGRKPASAGDAPADGDHRERFNRLLGAAVKPRKSSD